MSSHPAKSVLNGIHELVPGTQCLFAPIDQALGLVASQCSTSNLAALTDEYRRQRAVSPVGPRIAATLRPFADFTSGITMIFADGRADYGLITLLRDRTLPPFSSIEVGILTFALDAGSERMAAHRLQLPVGQKSAFTANSSSLHEEALYVLDHNLEIVLAGSSQRQRIIAGTSLEHRGERLPPVLEASVRELTAAWSTSPIKEHGVARPVPFLVVRTQPLFGPAGLFVGVRIERFHPSNSLTGAAERFHITPREVQVLALILDGNQLDQIARQLYITSSTVQDHIASMLEKTKSRNRTELIARVLGWESVSEHHHD